MPSEPKWVITMPLPGPRPPADNMSPRETFLAACAHMFDHAREASQAEMLHGAHMILSKLGGTLLLRGENSVTKRGTCEAAYFSDGYVITDINGRRLN